MAPCVILKLILTVDRLSYPSVHPEAWAFPQFLDLSQWSPNLGLKPQKKYLSLPTHLSFFCNLIKMSLPRQLQWVYEIACFIILVWTRPMLADPGKGSVIWMRVTYIGSHMWIFGGTIWEWLGLGGMGCWSMCVTGSGLWGFKSPHNS